MNYKKIFVGTVCALSALSAINAYAEGNPEYVKFPTGYETSFANYTTMNRDGKEQVAKMYANDAAISSYKKGQTAAPGSVVVMEVYKPKKDADGKSIVGSDGIYEIGKLAAVAVMERRDAWEAAYSPDHRLGNWGFAIYKPDGTPKPNKLACVECHSPLEDEDFIFSYQQLMDYVKSN